MRFFASAAAVMAMISAAAAQAADFDPIFEPQSGATINAGSTFEVTWEAPEKYQDGTISIHLIGGASDTTLVPIADIASEFYPVRACCLQSHDTRWEDEFNVDINETKQPALHTEIL
jgi:hypothetical protein